MVKDQIKTLHNNDNSNSINSNNKIKSTTFTYHPYIQDKNQWKHGLLPTYIELEGEFRNKTSFW